MLIDLKKILPNARFDIRYATADNFINEPVYSEPKAFFEQEPARALVAANQFFNRRGYGIVVWDSYRPFSVSRLFWDRTPSRLRSFLGDPTKDGSPHNRGCAIDMTLYDLATGKQLVMPSEFDDFSEKAKIGYHHPNKEARENCALLQRTMKNYGFEVRADEWWHYDWQGFEKYPLRDTSFADLH